MAVFAVDIDFAEHRERHAIGGAAEGCNLLFAARLLAQELVAREAQHGETVFLPGLLNVLQLFVLRRQATFGCHVDDKQHVAFVAFQRGVIAINGGHFSIQDV